MERKEPFDLVASLRSQVEANAERLRRNRAMVEVINEHLENSIPAKRRKKRVG